MDNSIKGCYNCANYVRFRIELNCNSVECKMYGTKQFAFGALLCCDRWKTRSRNEQNRENNRLLPQLPRPMAVQTMERGTVSDAGGVYREDGKGGGAAMKVRYSHCRITIPCAGWMEFDIKYIKKHWWSRWKAVMDTPSCPMFYNIKHFDENGKEFYISGDHSFDSVTIETSD